MTITLNYNARDLFKDYIEPEEKRSFLEICELSKMPRAQFYYFFSEYLSEAVFSFLENYEYYGLPLTKTQYTEIFLECNGAKVYESPADIYKSVFEILEKEIDK